MTTIKDLLKYKYEKKYSNITIIHYFNIKYII